MNKSALYELVYILELAVVVFCIAGAAISIFGG